MFLVQVASICRPAFSGGRSSGGASAHLSRQGWPRQTKVWLSIQQLHDFGLMNGTPQSMCLLTSWKQCMLPAPISRLPGQSNTQGSGYLLCLGQQAGSCSWRWWLCWVQWCQKPPYPGHPGKEWGSRNSPYKYLQKEKGQGSKGITELLDGCISDPYHN